MAHHPPITISADDVSAPESGFLARVPIMGLVFGLIGIGAGYATAGDHLDTFYLSYLVAFMFCLSFALGGLFFVLVQFATRAGWSVTVRRLAEHVMSTLPVFILLFIPIALGFHDIYHHWLGEKAAHDPLVQHKAPYLNATGFFLRAAVYLAIWTALAWFFGRQSASQDATGEPAITRRLQSLSAPALILFGLSLTFAAVDWIMTLDPHWYSTIFGVYYFAGCVVAICSLLILLALRLQAAGKLRGLVTFDHYHDLGKLLFAFTVFWAYIAFSQFMLIWYGNIPEETVFFAHRWDHGWKPVSIFLAIGHFGMPFLFLLLRDVKRHRTTLTFAALWMIAMHYLDIYWLVMPSHGGFHPSPSDILCLVGVGGIFLAALGWVLRGKPLVPVKDPRLAESVAFENF